MLAIDVRSDPNVDGCFWDTIVACGELCKKRDSTACGSFLLRMLLLAETALRGCFFNLPRLQIFHTYHQPLHVIHTAYTNNMTKETWRANDIRTCERDAP